MIVVFAILLVYCFLELIYSIWIKYYSKYFSLIFTNLSLKSFVTQFFQFSFLWFPRYLHYKNKYLKSFSILNTLNSKNSTIYQEQLISFSNGISIYFKEDYISISLSDEKTVSILRDTFLSNKNSLKYFNELYSKVLSLSKKAEILC